LASAHATQDSPSIVSHGSGASGEAMSVDHNEVWLDLEFVAGKRQYKFAYRGGKFGTIRER
jgi:hypothetical protein